MALVVVAFIAYVVNPIVGTFLGGVAGWAVGQLYGDHLIRAFASLGGQFPIFASPLEWWDVGCLLGFIGGFFKGFR
jgi:ABC-type dipeptide/oligopeptide/nickel transport system permease component